jgi:hypothetical protein
VQCLRGAGPYLTGVCLFPHALCTNKGTKAARRVAVRSRRRSFRKIPNVTEVPAYCNYIRSSKRPGISFGFSTSKAATATPTDISCFSSSWVCVKYHMTKQAYEMSVHRYSETNVAHSLLNLLRVNSLYMFRALLAHHQEALNKPHLVYCVQVMSVGCTRIGGVPQSWCSQLA